MDTENGKRPVGLPRSSTIRVGIYARVSTSDKSQDPETKLLPLREFAETQRWIIFSVYTDQVPAADVSHRTEWRRLLNDASKGRIDLVLVWRMDRAFRSVLDAANTLERLRTWGVGLRSYSEPWLDTTSPFGEALYYITVGIRPTRTWHTEGTGEGRHGTSPQKRTSPWATSIDR